MLPPRFWRLCTVLILCSSCAPAPASAPVAPTLPAAPPSARPSATPLDTPTSAPTRMPTAAPSETPTRLPTGAPEIAWIRAFEGPDYGAFFDLTLTTEGNLLVVGATNHLHVPPYSGDALLVELTAAGEVLWERSWGGEGYEQADAVTPAAGGGYYVFGETDSYGAGDRDFFLLKTSAQGEPEWYQTYGGPGREWPYGMLPLANGDLLIYGFSESSAGSRDEYAVRLAPDGKAAWAYTRQEPGEALVMDALETATGELVLVVNSEEDGKLVKLDASGQRLWEQRYALPGWQFASQLAPAAGGGYLLAGFSMSSSPRQADTWLAQCSEDGALTWETSFGEPGFDDYATSLLPLQDGSYLLGAIGNGVLLTRLAADGSLLERFSLLNPQRVYGSMALAELPDGSLVVAGLIQLVNGRSYDAFVLRTANTDAGQD